MLLVHFLIHWRFLVSSFSLLLPHGPLNSKYIYIYILNFYCLFIIERQSVSKGGAERRGDTESEPGCRLQAVSTEPDTGLELTDREIVT